MKTNVIKVVMVMVIFAITSLSGFSQENNASKNELKTVCFKSNLHCQSCVKKINENIAYEKGVKDLNVDLPTNTITVTYKASKTTEEDLAKAIIKLGYKADKQENVKGKAEKQ